jgi:hypothetical protein
MGASSDDDRAGRAEPQAPAGLGHTATIPCAGFSAVNLRGVFYLGRWLEWDGSNFVLPSPNAPETARSPNSEGA